MKKQKKREEGITLVTLVITIIVLIILVSVTSKSGIEFLETSRLKKLTAELTTIQIKVNEIYENLDNMNMEEIGTVELPRNSERILINLGIPEEEKKHYRFLKKQDLEKIGIEGIDRQCLINFKDRKVIDYEGVKYEGKMYYTLEQLPGGLYNVEYKANIPTFDYYYKWIGKNTWDITITNIKSKSNIKKWKVKYQYENDREQISEELTFRVNKKGKYKITVFNDEIHSKTVTLDIVDLKIGDYVNYKPINTNKEYTYLVKDIDANEGIQFGNKTIKEENLVWRVYNIENDGSIELIADSTNEQITLYGFNGYNDGVDIINEACEKLYSDEDHHIKARSITIEDLDKKLTEAGKNAKKAYKSKGGANPGQLLTYSGIQEIPELYQKEQGFNDQKTGLQVSDSAKGTNVSNKVILDNGLNIRQTYWHVNVDETNYGETAKVLKPTNKVNSHYQLYWGASRYVDAAEPKETVRELSPNIGFGIYMLGTNNAEYVVPNFNSLFYSYGRGTKQVRDKEITGAPIRPMVRLSAEQIDLKMNKQNSQNNKHEIIWNEEV